MSTTEYRAVYMRDNRRQVSHYTFPKMDARWGSYFHDISPGEVIGWEQRTISDWRPVE